MKIKSYLLLIAIIISSRFVFAGGFLGPDTAICPLCVTLSMPSGSNYMWSTGENTQSISVCTDTTVEIWASYEDISADPPDLYIDTILISLIASYPDTTSFVNNVIGCFEDCIQVNAPDSGYKYSWSPSTGLDDYAIQIPEVCITEDSFLYNVTVTMDTGLKCQYIFPVKIIAAPVAEEIQTDYTICKDSCVILRGPTNGKKFTWSPDTNIDNTNIQTPEVCLSDNAVYIITSETDTVLNCTYTDTVFIMVNDTCHNTFITAVDLSKIVYYPNPVYDILNINLPDVSENVQINIIDQYGKIVYSTIQGIISDYTADVSFLSSGNYFLEVANENNRFLKKVLILD